MYALRDMRVTCYARCDATSSEICRPEMCDATKKECSPLEHSGPLVALPLCATLFKYPAISEYSCAWFKTCSSPPPLYTHVGDGIYVWQ